MTEVKKIRTRFAPSPTGFVHVGSLRTALYNYLFARQNGGDFLLRIEDTDQKRYVEGAVEMLIDSLQWAGLDWDEGVKRKSDALLLKSARKSVKYPGIVEFGAFGPYAQSERLDIYKKYALELVEKGAAYYCFCDARCLERMRLEQENAKQAPMYDRRCAELSADRVREKRISGESYVIRLNVDRERTIMFDDMVRGRVSFQSKTIDDQVLMKSDGFPTYHLASVVDDHLMRITHVIRGEEWLPSTPKHILLYEAFGWDAPHYAHIPLLLNPDKSKLSKRQGDVAVSDYEQSGYRRDALVNFIALLGWNPGRGSTQEIFSLEELVKAFDIQKVHKAGAVFDLKKLDWINAQYIKGMNSEDLYESAVPFLERKAFFQEWKRSVSLSEVNRKEFVQRILAVERERMNTLASVGDEHGFFFFAPDVSNELLRWKDMSDEQVQENLKTTKKVLESVSDDQWNVRTLEQVMMEVAGEKRGEFLWPLRMALTGAQKSPSPFDVAWVIGKKETIARIRRMIR